MRSPPIKISMAGVGTFLAESNADSDDGRALLPLQAASCTYRIAFSPRGWTQLLQQVFSIDLKHCPCAAASPATMGLR